MSQWSKRNRPNGARVTVMTPKSNENDGNAASSTDDSQADRVTNAKEQPLRICFNLCRQEQYHPNHGYKQLARKLRQSGVVETNKEDISLDRLLAFDIVVFASPQDALSDDDLQIIREYISKGGSVLLMLGDGHGGKYTYLNKFLSDWIDTTVNEDCVVHTVLHKYLHPKEVCVTSGVTNRAINRAAGKNVHGAMGGYTDGDNDRFASRDKSDFGSGGGVGILGRGNTVATLDRTVMNGPAAARAAPSSVDDADANKPSSLIFVYPYGLTFNANRPSIVLLSSGFMAYPLNRPIAVAWESPKRVELLGRRRQGKLLVTGSALIFEDAWLVKEENDKLATVLFDYLNHKIQLNQIDADEPDITDYNYLPDTAALAERLRVAVEQQDELPRDFTKLFELSAFKLDTDKIPNVMETYEKLNVKVEPLNLIPPEFQIPLPPFKPAVFPPIFHDPPAPALDLFDLDEEFAQERVRLSQLTNKCKAEDVEFYIMQAAEIMGVTKKLRSPRNRDPRALLDYIFRQIVHYKKGTSSGPARDSIHGTSTLSQPGHAAEDSHNSHTHRRGSEQAHFHINQDEHTAMAAAAATRMTRVIRVVSTGSATAGGSADSTPFHDNPHWTLMLEADFAAGTIQGSLSLHDGSMRFPAQEVRVEGDIKQPDEREYPMEWGVVLVNTNGEQEIFVFVGIIKGDQLRGLCERGGGGTGTSQSFSYLIEDL